MTIKRRLFLSNILMIAVPVALFIVFSTIMSLVMLRYFEGYDGDTEELRILAGQTEYLSPLLGAGIVALAVMVAIIIMTNGFLTRRALLSITAPLDTLSYGVKQVHDGNLSFRLEYLGDDEFAPVCADFNQMTERLEYLEIERLRDEKSRKELVAGISHDLKTPLTAIKAYLEGIEKGVAASPEQRGKYIGIIKGKADDMDHIINQLFLFSKLETSEFPIHPERVNIGSAISGMIDGLAAEYACRGLSLQLAQPIPDATIEIDTKLLRNVIVNVLENSVNYKQAERGTVSVTGASDQRNVTIRFADDGPGVPPDSLDKLFDVFYRVDPSRTAKGNGLGLAISAKIMERMGGRISAELPAHGGMAIDLVLPLIAEGRTVLR